MVRQGLPCQHRGLFDGGLRMVFTETYPGHMFDLSRNWKWQTVPEELMEVLLEIAKMAECW